VNSGATKSRKEGKRGEADLGEVLSFTVAVLWRQAMVPPLFSSFYVASSFCFCKKIKYLKNYNLHHISKQEQRRLRQNGLGQFAFIKW
jgi:hypothetical protein